MLDRWEQMHELYNHDEQRAVQNTVPDETLCRQMGFCVCDGLGFKALCFHRKLVACLRPQFTPVRRRKKLQPDGTKKIPELPPAEKEKEAVVRGHRKLLQESFIVLRLQHVGYEASAGARPSATNFLHDSWSRMAYKALGLANPQEDPKTLWLHIGHLNLTTWRMAVLPLDEDPEQQDDGSVRLTVQKPSHNAADSVVCFCRSVNLQVRWSVTAFSMISDGRELTLDEMVPNWVLVKKLPAMESACFWQGWEIEEERERAAAAAKQKGKKRAAAKSGASSSNTKHMKKRLGPGDPATGPDAEEVVENSEAADAAEPGIPNNDNDDDLFSGDDVEERERIKREEESLQDLLDMEAPSEASSSLVDEADLLAELEALHAQDASKPGPDAPADAAAVDVPEVHEPSASSAGYGPHGPRKTGEPTTVVVLPDLGEIRFNKVENNYIAICKDPRHVGGAECKRVRTANAPSGRRGSNPGQGRPLGLLVRWLQLAPSHATSEGHKRAIDGIRRADRVTAREVFKTLDGALALKAFERPSRDDEQSEPEIVK